MCSKDKATTKDVAGKQDLSLPYNSGGLCALMLFLINLMQSPEHITASLRNSIVVVAACC